MICSFVDRNSFNLIKEFIQYFSLAQYHIRIFNALQTLCILIRASFKKKLAEFTCDPLSLLFTPPDDESTMRGLIEDMSRILTDEFPISLKNLCLKLMLLMLTADQDVNENAMLPFFMANSVFEPLKVDISPQKKICYFAQIWQTLLY